MREGTPERLVPHRVFEGNRPSNMIFGGGSSRRRHSGSWSRSPSAASSPRARCGTSIGLDQWGVELGKVLAKRIIPEFTSPRKTPGGARQFHRRPDRSLSVSTKGVALMPPIIVIPVFMPVILTYVVCFPVRLPSSTGSL